MVGCSHNYKVVIEVDQVTIPEAEGGLSCNDVLEMEREATGKLIIVKMLKKVDIISDKKSDFQHH